MKKALIALMALAFATPAMAISRYNTPGMSCDSVRNALLREGAAVLRYPSQRKPGLTLYDRYVRSSNQCGLHEYADRAYVPARDTQRCPVLRCQPLPERGDGWPRRIVPRDLPL